MWSTALYVVNFLFTISGFIVPSNSDRRRFKRYRIAFILLGLMGIFLTYQNDMQHKSAEAELTNKLSIIGRNTEVPAGVKNRREIKEQIGQFLNEGYILAAKCEDDSKPIPTDESTLWINKVENVLQQRLGKGYAMRFGDGTGLRIVVPIADDKRADLLESIKIRTTRLTEFIAELRD